MWWLGKYGGWNRRGGGSWNTRGKRYRRGPNRWDKSSGRRLFSGLTLNNNIGQIFNNQS